MARPRDPGIDRLVVDACVELLDERGRAGLSRAQIAERAGVSLPAVNRRFADVEEILVQVASTPGRALGAPTARPDDTVRDFLVAGLVALARAFAAGGVRRAAAELLAAAGGDPRIDEAFRSTLASLRTDGLARIEQAKVDGEIGADVDADLVLDLVTGSAYYRLLWRGAPITEDDVGRIVDVVLNGAAPRRPSASSEATSRVGQARRL